MKNNIILLTISLAFLLAACNNRQEDKENKIQKDSQITKEQTCLYSYLEGSASINWLAFKTTEKIGVNGQFNTVNVIANDTSSQVTDVLKSLIFNIPTNSTNTNDSGRDAKIKEYFFGKMVATETISGKVKNAEGNNEKGTCTFYLSLNNIEKELILDYVVANEIIKLTGEIDIRNWNAEPALKALNDVCKALHTGADGISKTWPTVSLEINAQLKKDCK